MSSAEPLRTDEAIAGARGRRLQLAQCMVELEAVVAAAAPEREKEWSRRLAAAVDSLVVSFDHHVRETEEPDGFLEEVVADAPRLQSATERVRDDHAELADLIGQLRDDARNGAATASPASAALREASLQLLGRLARHRQLGADLILEAYQVDIGPGD